MPARRLAAIMFTDLQGYTELSQKDERGALSLLKEQDELVEPLLAAHNGHQVKSMGDGRLVEFLNARDAIVCAVEIQRAANDHSIAHGDRPLRIRIGVHIGDVEQKGADILGDAVNIAARVEPLSEAGGICLTAQVYDQVRNQLAYRFERLGTRSLKGIRNPIDVYRVVLPWVLPEAPPGAQPSARLAVLPLVNISPDPKDEYLADGLTEELISVLSRLRGLRVIARTSIAQYKSTSRSIPQIGSELDVNWILEGSVRKVGDQLRITLQLIDVETQGHTWAKTYDRKLENVFALQAEVAKRVAKQLKVDLLPERTPEKPAPSIRVESYLAYLKGRSLLHTATETSCAEAKAQFELAISLEPQNAGAHSGLADALRYLGWANAGLTRTDWEAETRQLATRAIELDPGLAEAHASLGLILLDDFDYPTAEKEFRTALGLNPSYAEAHSWYAALLEDEVRTEEALRELTLAEKADPRSAFALFRLAELLVWLGKLEEAYTHIQKLGEVAPNSASLHFILSRYHLARSEIDRSVEDLRRAEAAQTDPRMKRIHRGWEYALTGRKDELRALLAEEEALPVSYQVYWALAALYSELGDLDASFRTLERALDSRTIYVAPLRLSPRLDQLRADPRFADLLRRVHLLPKG